MQAGPRHLRSPRRNAITQETAVGRAERPAPPRTRPPLTRATTFVAAIAAFTLVFASAGSPIPMYGLLRDSAGLDDSDFAFASAGYFLAAVGSLLLLGRLSNHLGRRPVVLGALAATAIGAALLPLVTGPETFIALRVLQGLAAGVAPSAVGALVIDTAPPRPAWLPALVTGSTPMLGIPLGALSSAVAVDLLADARLLVAGSIVAAAIAIGAAIALSAETMPTAPGAWRSLRPRVHVPAGAGRLLLAAGSSAIATWSLGGFLQAFAPSLAATSLGADDALVAAAVFSSMMILNPVGGPLAGRLTPAVGVRLGMGIVIAAMTVLVVATRAGALPVFLLASLSVGIAQGIASTSAMRALVTGLAPHERAGLLASVYLISYSGTVIPGLISGRAAESLSPEQIFLGYAALGVVAAVTAMVAITSRRPRGADDPGEVPQ